MNWSVLVLRVIAAWMVSFGAANLTQLVFWLDNKETFIANVIIFITLFSFTIKATLPKKKKWFLFSLIPLFLFGFWCYFIGEFGQFNWSSIIYHFTTGLGDSGQVSVYMQKAYFALLAVCVMSIGMVVLLNYVNWFSKLDKIFAILLLVFNPAISSAAISTFIGQSPE